MRDWLRTHKETAICFKEAKVARWRSGEGELAAYQSDKAVFSLTWKIKWKHLNALVERLCVKSAWLVSPTWL